MGFYAANFIYDSIISSEYGLRISSINSGGSDYDGANVEVYTQEIYRKPKVYLLGVQQKPVLQIPITITVPQELSANESSVISNWLFGQIGYKKLQILQSDMQYIYFNCIFVSPQVIRIGNVIRGYNATILCDSPYAWEYPQVFSKTYSLENYVISDSFSINNISDNPDYSYPIVSFKINLFGGSITLTNTSDSNRIFSFTDLNPNEIITVDNELQIITSSVSGVNRLTNFTNYKWLRYIPKINNFTLTGNIAYIIFTNTFARKIS